MAIVGLDPRKLYRITVAVFGQHLTHFPIAEELSLENLRSSTSKLRGGVEQHWKICGVCAWHGKMSEACKACTAVSDKLE